MDVIFLLGRVLLAVTPFMNGLFHFQPLATQLAEGKGAPAAAKLVPVSGAALIAGALSIAFGVLPDLGALVLIATILPITFYMHAFWKESDPQSRQLELVQFQKNLSLVGGYVVLFWVFNQLGDAAPATLTDSLFDTF